MAVNNKKKVVIAVLIALITSISLFLLFGIATSIIPNKLFTRMTPIGWLEYASLLTTSLLLGVYIGLTYYQRKTKSMKCDAAAASGSISGFLTFGCSICNKLLVFLLGIIGVLTYFEPIRPIFGILGLGLLSGAIFYKARGLI